MLSITKAVVTVCGANVIVIGIIGIDIIAVIVRVKLIFMMIDGVIIFCHSLSSPIINT